LAAGLQVFRHQEADMQAIQSNTGPSAVEYVLIALSVTLLVSISLAGGLAIPRQYEARTLAKSTRNQNTPRFAVEGAWPMRQGKTSLAPAESTLDLFRARRAGERIEAACSGTYFAGCKRPSSQSISSSLAVRRAHAAAKGLLALLEGAT
jgi:hypothetical protein